MSAASLTPATDDFLSAVLTWALRPEVAPIPPEDFALWANWHCARELAHCVGPLMGLGEADVFDILTRIPDNMLSLLDSPQGWTALAEYIAQYLRLPGPLFMPVIH
ncbi:hypothetical protein U8326_00075 [Tsuneonella sp. CC-YZS046]|uniref:hypothetical protein n=1 Tax=Tsuneonella sp. CC-YZS046 TaxID=3042152 RepID=UPI002D77E659|nr:hypothetical protein [Tsuneonella sp. CC-YZS046]WRO66600.1 hypothetical protein U8326_00075 [Tsuneonella sp. CC-YZS046]